MKRPLTQLLTRARNATGLAVALCVLLAPRQGLAAPSCTVSVAGGIAFGAYDPLSPTHLDSTGRIVLDCPPGRIVAVALGAGQAGTFTARELRGPTGEVLLYNLYRDAARTLIWGDGSTGVALAIDGTKGKTIDVYARVFAGQDVSVGGYADTIVVTVQF